MDCPHCNQELPGQPCPACEQPTLTGAGFCHHCGQALPAPAAEPPKLLACDSCGRKALAQANYCADCGQPLPGAEGRLPARVACSLCGHQSHPGVGYCAGCGEPLAGGGAAAEEGFDPGERRACSDGMCIGIIGADGKCTECGKPYNPHAD